MYHIFMFKCWHFQRGACTAAYEVYGASVDRKWFKVTYEHLQRLTTVLAAFNVRVYYHS